MHASGWWFVAIRCHQDGWTGQVFMLLRQTPDGARRGGMLVENCTFLTFSDVCDSGLNCQNSRMFCQLRLSYLRRPERSGRSLSEAASENTGVRIR